MARLAGETTPSMCQFEPIVCGHRYYCPLGEKEKICVQKALTALAGHMSRSNVASVPTTRWSLRGQTITTTLCIAITRCTAHLRYSKRQVVRTEPED